MRFSACALLMVCLAALLAGLSRVPMAAQSGASTGDAAAATATRPRRNPQQAYTLPPDKLAKAIALSRIRNIWTLPDRFGASSYFGCCWPREAPPGWRVGRRGFRAALDSGAGLLRRLPCHHLAGQPAAGLDRPPLRARLRDQRAGVGSWFGDEAKALGLTLCSARRFCFSSTGLCGAGRGGTGSGSGW